FHVIVWVKTVRCTYVKRSHTGYNRYRGGLRRYCETLADAHSNNVIQINTRLLIDNNNSRFASQWPCGMWGN
ncbi:MAG: hypothetical protein ACXADH_15610, partial [Candidatus Kariarchaeaceae archaeon]